MTKGVPVTFKIGRIFQAQDDLLIGQGIWDNTDPVIHRIGVGSGDVGPRWYPGVDKAGNLFLTYNTLIKSDYKAYGNHGFGFEGEDFVVRMHDTVILRANRLGVQLTGALLQSAADPEYLPSHAGLAELLFPLFTDKTLIAQFNRPAVAGIDSSNKFKAYRDVPTFLNDFASSFARGGTADTGFVRGVDSSGNYSAVLGNQPRITYSPNSKKCLGLLIEPATSNLILQSFNLPAWSTNTGITFNSESNTSWANKRLNSPFNFVEAATNTEHSGTQTFTADPTKPISASFFFQAKSFTGSRRFQFFVSTPDRSQLFGIILNAVSMGAPTYSASVALGNGVLARYAIDDVGSGIYRIKITGTLNALGSNAPVTTNMTFASLGDAVGNSNLIFSPGANTGNWCLINDFQAEQSPFVTSYIQTVSQILAKGADILSLNLANFRYSPSEGIFNLKFRMNPNVVIGANVLSLQNTDASLRMDFFVSAIDTNAGTITIGSTLKQSGTTTNLANYTVNLTRSDLVINYTNIAAGFTKAVISGETGFFGTVSLLSYE